MFCSKKGKTGFLSPYHRCARRHLWRIVGAFLIFVIISIFTNVWTTVASGPSSNRMLNYQLRLTDPNGIPVADGTQSIKISFYDAATAGTRLATDCGTTGTPVARKVIFTNSVGSALIGDTGASGTTNCSDGSAPNAIAATLFDNTVIFLGITVGSDAEMMPRKRIVATGFALNADKLDDLDSSNSGGTGAFVPVASASGLLTLTGNPTGTAAVITANPAAAQVSANDLLLDLKNNGTSVFKVDVEGDTTISGKTIANQGFELGGVIVDTFSDFFGTIQQTEFLADAMTYSGTLGADQNSSAANILVGSTQDQSTFVGKLFGINARGRVSTGAALTDATGGYFDNLVSGGTLTNGYGLQGVFNRTGGTVTRGYGVYGKATGATTNFAGYFSSARVQIDADDTPDSPDTATTAGSLFVSSHIETDGNINAGGDVAVDGGDITTSATAFNLINATATAVNFAGAATTLSVGAAAGTISTPGGLSFSTTGKTINYASGSDGNTFIWKIPTRSSGTCSNGAAEGVIIQKTDGTQAGHFCIDAGTSNLAFYANAFNSTSTDIAEMYSTRPEENIEAGDVVDLDPTVSTLMVRKSSSAYSAKTIGVISTSPGVAMSGIDESTGASDTTNGKYVALKGRAPVKVSAENGAIGVGDYLTSSSVAGVAMKANKPGMMIGRALDNFSGPGIGTVRVFVEVGWQAVTALGNDGSSGAWSISPDGRMIMKEIKAELVRTKQFSVEVDDSVQMTGEGAIIAGANFTTVLNPAVKRNSRIFVTFYGNAQVGWWISRKDDGAFDISLAGAAPTDIPFEYWILDVIDNRDL